MTNDNNNNLWGKWKAGHPCKNQTKLKTKKPEVFR